MVPFWLANLAPALVGMPFGAYAAATLIGIIPGTAVFAGIGAGVGEILAAGQRPDLSVIFSPAHPAAAAGPGGALPARRLVAQKETQCLISTWR